MRPCDGLVSSTNFNLSSSGSLASSLIFMGLFAFTETSWSSASGGWFSTMTVTVPVATPPRPSLIVYPNLSVPDHDFNE